MQLALQLASDIPALGELRTSLRELMAKSPLCDGTNFARHVESTYRNMWRRYCKGDVPSLKRLELLQQEQRLQQLNSNEQQALDEPAPKFSDSTGISISKDGSLGSIKANGFTLGPSSILNHSSAGEENGVRNQTND